MAIHHPYQPSFKLKETILEGAKLKER